MIMPNCFDTSKPTRIQVSKYTRTENQIHFCRPVNNPPIYMQKTLDCTKNPRKYINQSLHKEKYMEKPRSKEPSPHNGESESTELWRDTVIEQIIVIRDEGRTNYGQGVKMVSNRRKPP